MQATVFHLEKLPAFVRRAVELNRLHAPDDDLHDAILEGATGDGAAHARHVLQTIHRHFPEGASLAVQAAYLVRAFGGLRPFSEANHRTGWDVMAEVLQHAGHQVLATPDEIRSLGNTLWEDLQGFQEEDLEEVDDAARMLESWFHTRIA